jgi:hypothetical protein
MASKTGFLLYPDFFESIPEYIDAADIPESAPRVFCQIVVTKDVFESISVFAKPVRSFMLDMLFLHGLNVIEEHGGWPDAVRTYLRDCVPYAESYRIKVMSDKTLATIEERADFYSIDRQYAVGVVLFSAYHNPIDYNTLFERYKEKVLFGLKGEGEGVA